MKFYSHSVSRLGFMYVKILAGILVIIIQFSLHLYIPKIFVSLTITFLAPKTGMQESQILRLFCKKTKSYSVYFIWKGCIYLFLIN